MDYSEYLNRRDWQAGNLLQKWFSKRILSITLKIINRPSSELSLLEVGSGIGILGLVATELGFERYEAIEPNSDLAQATRNNIPGSIIHEFYLPNVPDSMHSRFDIVIAVHVIEHAESGYQAREWIENLWETVAPGGLLVIVSPEILDFKGYFWNIDWSHCFPTSVNSLKQIFLDLQIPIEKAKVARMGSISPLLTSLAFCLTLLIPTRIVNAISRNIIGRELGTGLKAGALWGTTFVVGKK
jgi:2-polyprenyl-3-methyl-5-hydroxy-6-metoxy-1,4-benzoquinol methylase